MPTFTAVDPVSQRQLFLSAAAAAQLGRRVPLIYLDKVFSPVHKLIFQHPQEHPVSVIHGGFVIIEIFVRYSFHIQGLDAYDVIRIGHLRTFLLQVIESLVRRVFLDPGDFLLLFYIIVVCGPLHSKKVCSDSLEQHRNGSFCSSSVVMR